MAARHARIDHPWRLRPLADAGAPLRLARELGLPAVGAEVLARRGHSDPATARAFLAGERPHDPALLPELMDAARRLLQAAASGERIVVHGDYDADGITGTALLTGALRAIGANAQPFVPDRKKDGYGVSLRLVEHAGQSGVKLLVTVDTGSSAHEALDRARALGMQVIVCDHHLFQRRPDGATWFLNPHREDSTYPNRGLCGAAVAHKLVEGMAKLDSRVDADAGLDLVAVGLLADQMPLEGENRQLVRMGLDRLQHAARPGLLALMEVSRLLGRRLEAEDIGFQLAPRINAAGRIGRAKDALELLLATDMPDARRYARKLDELNQRRRNMDSRLTDEAVRKAERVNAEGPAAGLVLASEAWHRGVVGIGAARVVEHFDVPAVLLAIDGEEAVGSARSVDGFDLVAALDLCADLLDRYGGHAAAAGMRLPAAQIDAFAARFAVACAELPRDAPPPALELDAVLSLEQLGPDLADFLSTMGPFGMGNPAPLFGGLGLTPTASPQVLKEKHLKLRLSDGVGRGEFMGFGMAEELAGQLGGWGQIDCAFAVRYREGGPFDPWQLTLRGLRPAGPLAGEGGMA